MLRGRSGVCGNGRPGSQARSTDAASFTCRRKRSSCSEVIGTGLPSSASTIASRTIRRREPPGVVEVVALGSGTVSLLTELDAFFTDHRQCGELDAGVECEVVMRSEERRVGKGC